MSRSDSSGKTTDPGKLPTAGGAKFPFDIRLAEGIHVARIALRRYRDTLSAEDMEDILQEIALGYWRNQHRVENLRSWFFACACNKARTLYKRRPLVKPLKDDDLVSDSISDSRNEVARQLFFNLRRHCMELLGRLVIEEWSPVELAAVTGKKARDLESQEARCLGLLRSRWRRLVDSVQDAPVEITESGSP